MGWEVLGTTVMSGSHRCGIQFGVAPEPATATALKVKPQTHSHANLSKDFKMTFGFSSLDVTAILIKQLPGSAKVSWPQFQVNSSHSGW